MGIIGAVVRVEVVALALRAELLLDGPRRARDGHEVNRATGQDAEVDAAAPVASGALFVELARGLVLELLLLGLREERL